MWYQGILCNLLSLHLAPLASFAAEKTAAAAAAAANATMQHLLEHRLLSSAAAAAKETAEAQTKRSQLQLLLATWVVLAGTQPGSCLPQLPLLSTPLLCSAPLRNPPAALSSPAWNQRSPSLFSRRKFRELAVVSVRL